MTTATTLDAGQYENTPMDDLDAGERRTARARKQAMVIVPRTTDEGESIGVYDVISQSGTEYTVDGEDGACDCPDQTHNRPTGGCKHIRRVEMERDERGLPAFGEDATNWFDTLEEQTKALATRRNQLNEQVTVITKMLDSARFAVREEQPQ